MDILMVLTFVSFVALASSLVLHSAQHYRCRCCIKSKYPRSLFVATNELGHSRSRAVVLRKQPSMTNTTHVPPPKRAYPRHQRSSSSMLDTRFMTPMSSLRGSLQFAFSGQKRQCQFCVFGVERDFDFFPAAFSLYILFLLFVLSLIVARSLMIHGHILVIVHHSIFDGVISSIGDLFWIELQRQWLSWTDQSSFAVHSYGHGVSGSVMDWVLAHCVLILAVWESLFNFYRCFTTM